MERCIGPKQIFHEKENFVEQGGVVERKAVEGRGISEVRGKEGTN
jgi:hypothetical protein